jgi:hypothetical protein
LNPNHYYPMTESWKASIQRSSPNLESVE